MDGDGDGDGDGVWDGNGIGIGVGLAPFPHPKATSIQDKPLSESTKILIIRLIPRANPLAQGKKGARRLWPPLSSLPGEPAPIPTNARWTWSDSAGWTWSGHPGSEGGLWQGRWTWYTLSKWTWSGKRCGGACELARDRQSRKGEVDLVQ